MTKISNKTAYATESPISENDYMIGTDGDSSILKTKTFNFGKIRNFVNAGLEPVTGGTLAINELLYTGPLTTPQDVVNDLVPNKTIMPYEVFLVNVNGAKYITSIQDRVVGDTQPPTNASDYFTIADGSETKITAGTNIVITGTGNTGSPYIINAANSSVPDATTTTKGILKLTNDLGGTADLPTTPTALHGPGNLNEEWTGIKSTTNTGNGLNNGLKLINNANFGGSAIVDIECNGNHPGILIVGDTPAFRLIDLRTSATDFGPSALSVTINPGSNSEGILIINKGNREAINIGSEGNALGIYAAAINGNSITSVIGTNDPSATGLTYVGMNYTDVTFTVDKLGNVTGNSFIKTGGTSSEFLKADGSTSTVADLLFQYQVIEMDVDAAYIAANFDANGIGINLMLGMAICNGYNGLTKNRTGKVSVGYGTGFTAVGTPGGSANAVVVSHTHFQFVDEVNTGGEGIGIVESTRGVARSASGKTDYNYEMSYGGLPSTNNATLGLTSTAGASGVNANYPPYLITLFVMKL